MSDQFLKRLGGALVGLLVIWLGLSLWRRSGQDTAGGFSFSKFDRKAADQAVIARATDTLRFARQADQWTVNGLRAGTVLVEQLFEALADTAAQSELIAESPSSHERLGVNDAKARRITVSQGGKSLTEILVGSRGGSWESAYVRKPGTDQVYQLKGRLFEMVERPTDDWRDKQLVKVEPDSITGLEVQLGRRSYQLTRNDKAWTIDGGPADSAAMVGLLSQFRDLNAAGFATQAQADSANFAMPDRVIRLATRAGPLATLSFDSAAAGIWVRREGDPTTYRLDSWVLNQLTPPDSTLKAKPKP